MSAESGPRNERIVCLYWEVEKAEALLGRHVLTVVMQEPLFQQTTVEAFLAAITRRADE